MKGYYTTTVREDYGKGILGPDFRITGQGKFSHITHVEVKIRWVKSFKKQRVMAIVILLNKVKK
jgi:hypothetical protein